jgi:hypothetical protein
LSWAKLPFGGTLTAQAARNAATLELGAVDRIRHGGRDRLLLSRIGGEHDLVMNRRSIVDRSRPVTRMRSGVRRVNNDAGAGRTRVRALRPLMATRVISHGSSPARTGGTQSEAILPRPTPRNRTSSARLGHNAWYGRHGVPNTGHACSQRDASLRWYVCRGVFAIMLTRCRSTIRRLRPCPLPVPPCGRRAAYECDGDRAALPCAHSNLARFTRLVALFIHG